MGHKKLAKDVLEHEGVKGKQTPFRITGPKMKHWTSMFDDGDFRLELDPEAKKEPKTENFLYAKRDSDVLPGVSEWFNRRVKENPNVTLKQAIYKFDQSNPEGKMKFLKSRGYDINAKLSDIKDDDNGDEMKRQLKARQGTDAPLEQGRPNTELEAEQD